VFVKISVAQFMYFRFQLIYLNGHPNKLSNSFIFALDEKNKPSGNGSPVQVIVGVSPPPRHEPQNDVEGQSHAEAVDQDGQTLGLDEVARLDILADAWNQGPML
jgi:hypothetical protein